MTSEFWVAAWNGSLISTLLLLLLVWVGVAAWWLLPFGLLAVAIASVMLDGEEMW